MKINYNIETNQKEVLYVFGVISVIKLSRFNTPVFVLSNLSNNFLNSK